MVKPSGSLEVKLRTIWTDEKQSREEAERGERLEQRRVERVRRKKKHSVFPMICGSGGGTSLWREAHPK